MRGLWLGISLALAAAGVSHAAERCPEVAGSAALWKTPATRYILFGEMHGTTEAPAIFGDVVCLANANRPVIVALEIPSAEQVALDRFLASPGSSEDVSALLAGPFWSQGAQDGRSSQAMVALIRRLREMKASGRTLSVLAFAPQYSPGFVQDYYELDMARALTVEARKAPDALVLVLVGNLHAARRMRQQITPAAVHLPTVETLTLNLVAGGGEAWNCQRDGCGPHRMGGDPAAPRGILMFEGPKDGFDGLYALGTLASASAPALP